MSTSQHTISAVVQNESGTLNRLVSLFRRRGFSLSSLNVGDCEEQDFSRLTLVVNGDDDTLQQCVTQLEKLIDVVNVTDLDPRFSVRRELALIKLGVGKDHRSEVLDVVKLMGGEVVHFELNSMTVELSAEPRHIDRLVKMLRPFGIREIARTGLVALGVDD